MVNEGKKRQGKQVVVPTHKNEKRRLLQQRSGDSQRHRGAGKSVFATALGFDKYDVQTHAADVSKHPNVSSEIESNVFPCVDSSANQNEEEGIQLEVTGGLRWDAGVEEGQHVHSKNSRNKGLNIAENAECGNGDVLESHGRCNNVAGEQESARSPRQQRVLVEGTALSKKRVD